jgi:hypothetical protein
MKKKIFTKVAALSAASIVVVGSAYAHSDLINFTGVSPQNNLWVTNYVVDSGNVSVANPTQIWSASMGAGTNGTIVINYLSVNNPPSNTIPFSWIQEFFSQQGLNNYPVPQVRTTPYLPNYVNGLAFISAIGTLYFTAASSQYSCNNVPIAKAYLGLWYGNQAVIYSNNGAYGSPAVQNGNYAYYFTTLNPAIYMKGGYISGWVIDNEYNSNLNGNAYAQHYGAASETCTDQNGNTAYFLIQATGPYSFNISHF